MHVSAGGEREERVVKKVKEMKVVKENLPSISCMFNLSIS